MITHLKDALNVAVTENGALARATTKSDVLDLFAMGGALRSRNEYDIERLFQGALDENALLALKCIFYLRDIRGGQGERRTFRVALKHLADRNPQYVIKNLASIVEFGRWDDLWTLLGTKVHHDVVNFVKQQLAEDMENLSVARKPVSLLAKWMPSENASSDNTKQLARMLRHDLHMQSKSYRKMLSGLRQRINVVERLMSSGEWKAINYEGVPSKAMLQYRKAFSKQDSDRFQRYLDSLQKGEAKINASALYPYDIVHQCLRGESGVVLDEQWKALPNYCEGIEDSTLCVVDVSGSMMHGGDSVSPIDIAISLGIYFAERNKGEYFDHFVTFSANPALIKLRGKTISDRVRFLSQADWGMNTNIEAVFDLILDTAVKNRLPQSEIPARVLIISDMEFDAATGGGYGGYGYGSRGGRVPSANKTLFQHIADKYKAQGYEMPMLVFWNVDSRQNQVPMTMNDAGVVLVSGASPSVFEAVAKGNFVSAYDMMLGVLNKPRYDAITI